MNEETLKLIKEKGLLLEKEIYELIGSISDRGEAKEFLEVLEKSSGQKIITKQSLNKNFEIVNKVVSNFPGSDKEKIEQVFIKMGLSVEVRKEREIVEKEGRKAGGEEKNVEERKKLSYKVISPFTGNDRKLKVEDFVGNFRARYQQLQRILMYRAELNGLVSINKIGRDRQSFSFIGIVSEKRVTKNKNMIIKFEDLTGEISALVKVSNQEVFSKAEEILLDDVVGIRASGNRDMVFVHDVIFPDSMVLEKTRFEEDVNVAFLSDLHVGGGKHLKESFEKFLDWVNSEDDYAKKIKYLFFIGDNVDGVGIFPGQENFLQLKSMKEQYAALAEYLKKIPKRITMFMCPGQHDAVRVAEPQPVISRNYAESLYEINNLVLVSNPSTIKLMEKEKEFKILMYHGDSIHSFIREIRGLREMKAAKTPAKAIKYMLKKRHLFPLHGEAIYIPNSERDPLIISEVPDVFCTGEVHRVDVENYNGVLCITGSCWQSPTAFEEKVGNLPDPGKVPVLNLKTRELKIFDFLSEESK